MTRLVTWLFSTDQLTPHGLCLVWRPDLIWALVFADGLIAASYFSIPLFLLRFSGHRRGVSFVWVALFGSFILLCGTTHLMDVATLWVPAYGLMVVLKIATALVSVSTAYALWTMMPGLLKLPTVTQLRDLNVDLENEINERKSVEATLRDVLLDLEGRVAERTRALARTSADLQREIESRRENEEFARRVIEAASDALIVVGETGCIERVNAQAERIFGYAAGELLGQAVEILLPTRFRMNHLHHRASFFNSPDMRQMGVGRELFGLRKDRSEFPVEIGLGPLKVEDGRKIITSIVDISRRKAIEHSLNQSQRQIRLMFDSIRGHAIFMLDATGHIVDWNAGAERLKGYQKHEIIGQHFSIFYPPEDVANGKPENELIAAASRGRVEDEGWRKRRDGSRFMANVIINAVRDDEGKLQGFVKVTRDITDRMEIENRLRCTIDHIAVAAKAAGIGFWDFDLTTQTLKWDDQMFEIYGLAREDGEQSSALWVSHLHPDDRDKAEDEVRAAAKGSMPLDTDFRIVRPDGRVRYVRAAAQTKCDENGRALKLLGVNFDITVRKMAEHDLKVARDIAEAANRSKSDFLAVMSHEIRTPMNGIMGMNALLLDTDLTDAQRRMAAVVRHSADSLLTIIDDILDISKLEAGKVDFEEIGFDVVDMVESAVELLKPRASQKGLVLEADTTRIARPAFRADPTRLRQVLLNLMSNAIKFTERGAVSVKVTTAVGGETNARLRFEVHDTGSGVDAPTKARLFKPFEQADSTITRRFGGTGLGLSICKKLVDQMVGHIGLLDRPGGGSIFWFEVVLPYASTTVVGFGTEGPACREQPLTARSGHILLAEDNEINIEVARLILERAGYTVDIATNGVEASAAVKTRGYDLVLMDMQMPILDGLSATREIRATKSNAKYLPIIAMTANAMKEDQRLCLEAGMDDFLSKPIGPRKLLDTVAHWIGDFDQPHAPEDDIPLSNLPVLDFECIDFLEKSLPSERIIPIIATYLESNNRFSSSISHLGDTSALNEMALVAHNVISTSGTIGARQLQDVATRLMDACYRDDRVAALKLLPSITRAFALVKATLVERFGSRLTAIG